MAFDVNQAPATDLVPPPDWPVWMVVGLAVVGAAVMGLSKKE